jgi:Polyketide cyclase / dehydrase and lipid transport
MIQHEFSIHVNRPVEQVFAFLVNLQNVPTWQSNLVEIRQLTPGALQVGSQVYQVRRFGRRYSEIRVEVTDFERNKRYATQTLTKPQVTMSVSLDRKIVEPDSDTSLFF